MHYKQVQTHKLQAMDTHQLVNASKQIRKKTLHNNNNNHSHHLIKPPSQNMLHSHL